MKTLAAGLALTVITAGGIVLSACGLVFDADDLDRGSADAALDTTPPSTSAPDARPAADASDVDAAALCPSLHGPSMIDADGVCIDATEVSVADYDEFQKRESSLLPLPEPCRWVAHLAPESFEQQLKTPHRPVVDVNYCHAFHYCAWAGKRLCGRVGGGAVALGHLGLDTQGSQWLRACTRRGTQAYSYGATVVPSLCTSQAVVDVGTRGACDGPYDGLKDMLGNVGEWIDGCIQDGNIRERDGCTVLGWERIRDEASCYDSFEVSRYQISEDLGFRCCGR